MTVFCGNCSCPKWPVNIEKCSGECSKKVSFKKSHIKNGDTFEWTSKDMVNFGGDNDLSVPDQVSVYLTAHQDGPHRTDHVFVENVIVSASSFKQDYETDKEPVFEREITKRYEYPESAGNPILKRGEGIVMDGVNDEAVTTTAMPTTMEEIATTESATTVVAMAQDTTAALETMAPAQTTEAGTEADPATVPAEMADGTTAAEVNADTTPSEVTMNDEMVAITTEASEDSEPDSDLVTGDSTKACKQ